MTWKLYPISEFGKHRHVWEVLNQTASGSVLLDPAFVQPLLDVFGSGKEVLACCEDRGSVRAMTILSPRGNGRWETFQPSQSPVGMWVSGPDGELADVLPQLISALPGFALTVGVAQQDPDILRRPAPNRVMQVQDHVQTAGIPVHGTFDAYWNARSKSLRGNLRTQRNKLERLGVTTRLDLVQDPADVADAVAGYGRLESTGWKARAGTAVLPDNQQGVFYRRLLDAFYAKGLGRIFRYWYDDRLVATHLCVEGNGMFIVLKMAYDETIGNDTSPSLLMLKDIFQQVFDEGRLSRIESYGKLVEWNAKWYDEIRTMYHVTGYRWAAIPRLRGVIRRKPLPALQQSGDASPVQAGRP